MMRLLRSMLAENIRKSTFSPCKSEVQGPQQEAAASMLVASVFLELINSVQNFVANFKSVDFLDDFVQIIFCCASQKAATIFQENSDTSTLEWHPTIIDNYFHEENKDLESSLSDEEIEARSL